MVYRKKNALTEIAYFMKIYYHTKFQDPTLSGIITTSEDCMVNMLIVLWHEIRRYNSGVTSDGIIFIPGIIKTHQLVIRGDRHTDMMMPSASHYKL
jgi:hypothetical protein